MTIEVDYRDVDLVGYEAYQSLSAEEKMVQRLVSAARVLSAMGLSPERPAHVPQESSVATTGRGRLSGRTSGA